MSDAHIITNIARAFHESYERQAPGFGYKTREASAVPWEDVPSENRLLMEAVVRDLYDRGIVSPGGGRDRPSGVVVHQSDLHKLSDALVWAMEFFKKRDEMNAAVHRVLTVRYSPITATIEAAYERVAALLGDGG